jgi:hypothetical protein
MVDKNDLTWRIPVVDLQAPSLDSDLLKVCEDVGFFCIGKLAC